MAANSTVSSNVQDKVFLVTGGAAGVGAALVRNLLAENAQFVAFLDINEHEGIILERDLMQKFGSFRAKFVKCDIANEDELTAAYEQVLDKCLRIDVVINNAAVLSNAQHYKRMIDVNFTATVSSTFKAIESMSTERGGDGGTIINIASCLALKQNSHLPVYSATKIAVLQFSNAFGAEPNYAKTKVRVITVCLGPTDTAILQKYNLENFNNDDVTPLTSRVLVRQMVNSAATGIIEVIKQGKSGSTWIVCDDKPAFDISNAIKDGYQIFSQYCIK